MSERTSRGRRDDRQRNRKRSYECAHDERERECEQRLPSRGRDFHRQQEQTREHSTSRHPRRIASRGYQCEEPRRDNRDSQARNTSERNKSSWDSSHSDEWTCFECRTWNPFQTTTCGRCGNERNMQRGRSNKRETSSGPRIEERATEKDAMDEFGRRKAFSTPASGHRWPPAFNRKNSTYVFDVRSAMFYHSVSQFFYDPKTKLYYDTTRKTYFQHQPGEHPPYKEFVQSASTSESAETNAAGEKNVISISLKTKIIAGKAKKEPKQEARAPTLSAESSKLRAQTADMEKWSERGREIRGKEQVVRTKTGSPVCLLCKRKFKDLAHLERHENYSETHQVPFTKYQHMTRVLPVDSEDEDAQYYRDRANERRVLHGSESAAPVPHPRGKRLATSDDNPSCGLDDSNVGNHLLKKLGWEGGVALGRNPDASNPMEKEWERIQRIAKTNR